jgi:hypothetical protein
MALLTAGISTPNDEIDFLNFARSVISQLNTYTFVPRILNCSLSANNSDEGRYLRVSTLGEHEGIVPAHWRSYQGCRIGLQNDLACVFSRLNKPKSFFNVGNRHHSNGIDR